MISIEDLRILENNATVGDVLSANFNTRIDDLISTINSSYISWLKYEANKNGKSYVALSAAIKASLNDRANFKILDISHWLCRSRLFIERFGIVIDLIWDIGDSFGYRC